LTVSSLPRIALVSTGDELVEVADTPLPWQIRRSNGTMLQAMLQTAGLAATLHHLPDDEAALQTGLDNLLKTNDILILSGGVSAGKADFVPDTLTRLGVVRAFHRIEQRPGRPLWFGAVADGAVVFALPGNPVSSVVCGLRYVLPFLRASLGQLPDSQGFARLSKPVTFEPDLTYFLPVALHPSPDDGGWLAKPLPGSGSADFSNLLNVNAFAELPADQSDFPAGTIVAFHSFRFQVP
jgi:molybdopterin molybdotransferase